MISDKKWLQWAAPLFIALSVLSSLLFPLSIPVSVFLTVYFDLRLGNRFQFISFSISLSGIAYLIFGLVGLIIAAPIVFIVFIVETFFRKGISFRDGLIYSIFSSFICTSVAVLLLYFYSGLNPIGYLMKYLDVLLRKQASNQNIYQMFVSQEIIFEWMDQATNDLTTLNTISNEIQLLSVDDLIDRLLSRYETWIRLYIPTAFIVYIVVLSLSSWVFPSFALKNRLITQKPIKAQIHRSVFPKSFLGWNFHRLLITGCAMILIAGYFINSNGNAVLFSVFSCIEWCARLILIVQGMSCAALWLQGKRVPTGFRVIIIIVAYIVFNTVWVLLGILDSSFGFKRMIILRRHRNLVDAVYEQYRDDPQLFAEKINELSIRLEKEEEAKNYSLSEKP